MESNIIKTEGVGGGLIEALGAPSWERNIRRGVMDAAMKAHIIRRLAKVSLSIFSLEM
jgi:hypothetical protein